MSNNTSQTPEQKVRDQIDKILKQAGWAVQNKDKLNFNASLSVVVREYQTDIGPSETDKGGEGETVCLWR